ncbi:MAG: carbohydrate porin [Gammaproteobacteria bacterium]|nr:carbohydrate porin [Gammaproteobacteria bacterium]
MAAAGGMALMFGHAAYATDTSDAYASWKEDLKAQGVQYAAGYRSEDLAAVDGGSNNDVVHAGQVFLSSTFDLQQLAGWRGASVTASLSLRDGDNVNDESGVGALLGPQEIYGRGHYFRLSQLWLDQQLFADQLALRIGRLNPGEDFQATECSFLNLSFCANQAGNFVADYWFNWPISQWGATATLQLGTEHYVRLGAYQVNQRNLGSDFWDVLRFDGGAGVLVPAEFAWTPTAENGRMTEFKIGGWYSSADRADVEEDINGESAAVSGLPFREHNGTYGTFVSLVKQLTRGDASSAESGLRMVLKVSMADPDTSTVDRTIAGTLVYTGTFPSRGRDDVGLALAFNHLNDRVADYRQALPSDVQYGGNERTIEAYYSLRVGRYLMFRPDIQWIHNAGGISQRDDVLIVGMRTELTL